MSDRRSLVAMTTEAEAIIDLASTLQQRCNRLRDVSDDTRAEISDDIRRVAASANHLAGSLARASP